ncbi:MAG: hypothetical protein KME18_24320 [Phormidium tanganyikae FI6-MK23]|jgi:hypothetical protein|nr:hypothetical protein [Phormidium tanganyikae FI6-MK23]
MINSVTISPEDLFLGSSNTFEVEIPPEVLNPISGRTSENSNSIVRLRPLTIGTFQLIMKAARQDAGLVPLLMIKEALVEPALSLEQVKQLHLGLVNFLIDQIRQVSGLTGKKN